jgi:Molybdopterin-binding domain of aldehyde dehydrogenase
MARIRGSTAQVPSAAHTVTVTSPCVQVGYEPLPACITIDDALAAGSFHPQFERSLIKGDVDAAFASDEVAVVVEGEARMGGQEHFYLEPHCNYVQPLEGDEYLLVASTQARGGGCLLPMRRCQCLAFLLNLTLPPPSLGQLLCCSLTQLSITQALEAGCHRPCLTPMDNCAGCQQAPQAHRARARHPAAQARRQDEAPRRRLWRQGDTRRVPALRVRRRRVPQPAARAPRARQAGRHAHHRPPARVPGEVPRRGRRPRPRARARPPDLQQRGCALLPACLLSMRHVVSRRCSRRMLRAADAGKPLLWYSFHCLCD